MQYLLKVIRMNHDQVYEGMLSILSEWYEKNSPYFVPSSELRAKLNTAVEDLRPYAEELEQQGYVRKLEGLSPNFIVKFTKQGHRAYKTHAL